MSSNYYTPATPIIPGQPGFIRYHSRQVATVALKEEHLSDKKIGSELEADLSLKAGGQYEVTINNYGKWYEISELMTAIDYAVKAMSNVAVLVDNKNG